jgi:hypothetical protein
MEKHFCERFEVSCSCNQQFDFKHLFGEPWIRSTGWPEWAIWALFKYYVSCPTFPLKMLCIEIDWMHFICKGWAAFWANFGGHLANFQREHLATLCRRRKTTLPLFPPENVGLSFVLIFAKISVTLDCDHHPRGDWRHYFFEMRNFTFEFSFCVLERFFEGKKFFFVCGSRRFKSLNLFAVFRNWTKWIYFML